MTESAAKVQCESPTASWVRQSCAVSMVPQVIGECLVCANEGWNSHLSARLPWLTRCPECGLIAVNPQPLDDELAEIYGEGYYGTFGFEADEDHGYRSIKQSTVKRFLQMAEQFICCRGRLIDVGSAVGDVLKVGSQRGWEVRGVEPNCYGAEAAEAVVPGATFVGSFEQFPIEDGPFTLVTCLDVLEHLRRPDKAIEKMHALLAPNGVLALTVPDVSSLLAKVLGSRWPHYHRDHMWYFNRRTLRRLVENRGFEVVFQGSAWKTFNLRYVLGILAANPGTGVLCQIAKAIKARLPRPLLNLHSPAIPEGQLLIARKCVTSARGDSNGAER